MGTRTTVGFGGLLFLALAVNMMAWQGKVFSALALAPLLFAAVLGVVWLVMLAAGVFSQQGRGTGRALGGLNAVIASVVVLLICMVAYAFVHKWDASWDLTQEGRRELAPQTVQLLQSMMEVVEVSCFFLNTDDDLVLIGRDKTRRFLEDCQKQAALDAQGEPLLKFEFLDPQRDVARLVDLELNTRVSPQGTVVVRTPDNRKNKRVLVLSGASPRLNEREFAQALINVLRDSRPRVGMLTGHGERSIRDDHEREGGSAFGNLLAGEGYDCAEVQISLVAPAVPDNCDVLIINNPQSDLPPPEVQALDAFIDRGGRLLVLMDPWRRVTPGLDRTENFRPWLKDRLLIDIGADVLVTDRAPTGVSPLELQLRTDMAPFGNDPNADPNWRGCYRSDHPVTMTLDQVMLLRWARTVRFEDDELGGVLGSELLRCIPGYWAESDVAGLFGKEKVRPDGDEPEGALSIAAGVTVGATDHESQNMRARVVVVGNANMAANESLVGDGAAPGNVNFLLNAMAWLTQSEELIMMRASGVEDPPVVLSPAQRRGVLWFSTLLTTQLVVAAGVAVFFLRRRYQ